MSGNDGKKRINLREMVLNAHALRANFIVHDKNTASLGLS